MVSAKRMRGRPRKNNARCIPFATKLNSDEVEKLVVLMETYNLTPSEALRLALNTCPLARKK